MLEECHLCCICRIQLDMLDIPVYDAAENKTERKSCNTWLSILIDKELWFLLLTEKKTWALRREFSTKVKDNKQQKSGTFILLRLICLLQNPQFASLYSHSFAKCSVRSAFFTSMPHSGCTQGILRYSQLLVWLCVVTNTELNACANKLRDCFSSQHVHVQFLTCAVSNLVISRWA